VTLVRPLFVGGIVLAASCADVPQRTQTVGSELAPTGTLRAGINYGNAILVSKGATLDQPAGIAPDLARQIAQRLDVPIAFVTYDSAAAMADDADAGNWDVAFLGADSAREDITFTAPYVELQAAYLVGPDSRIGTIADVDTDGVRIAARPRSAYDLVLRRTLARARLVYPEGAETDLDLLAAGKADAVAGLRQVLEDASRGLPGSRVLDGDVAAIQQAIGVPKGRTAAAEYLEAFVREMKESGALARAIERRGARGVSVARE
jgi:polar amino acid transport system substrate-binding protein